MDSSIQILKKYWGYDSFRPAQEEAIQAALASKDVLVLLPTGGGKSICFQVPTLQKGKLTIVVTPLIALMKDQVDQLRKRGIQAVAIHSGLTAREIDIALDNCIYGHVRFLYVSPERLKTDLFVARTRQMDIGLIAIDEAHCVSQWGYDFRPAYLEIADFRKMFKNVPMMALTATATEGVRSDIISNLQLQSPAIIIQSFARENLSYSVFETEDKSGKLLQILRNVKGSSIVYVRTRKQTGQLALWLQKNNIVATNYHAGIPLKERESRQQAWINNHVQVMVATNAFGMGIDKPDVRSVIHWDLPDSLEAYYQEAGRGGRDGVKSYAVALYNAQDLVEMKMRVTSKYPAIEVIKRVYDSLANHFQIPVGAGAYVSGPFHLATFCENFRFSSFEAYNALKILEQEGLIVFNEAYSQPSRFQIKVTNRDLYDFQLRHREVDALIKSMLRIYGGESFADMTPFSEETLAKALLIPLDRVQAQLKYLDGSGIIAYEQRFDGPQVMFLTPRYALGAAPVRYMQLQKRAEVDTKKLESVVHFATNATQCRSILLLDYFGEEAADYCGVCDRCLQRLKQEKNSLSYLKKEILSSLIPQQDLLLIEIRSKFGAYSEELISEALTDLIREEKVKYSRNGAIQLV